jgi:dTDP-4-dehydrorhamnose 3,5-epimerase
MIHDFLITPLSKIHDERGTIMHMLCSDAAHFEQFGEVYLFTVYSGVINGWHIHNRMPLNYAAITWAIRLALYDQRHESPTDAEVPELFLGDNNDALVRVPPGVWRGFKGVGPQQPFAANCATFPHNPQEIGQLNPCDPNIACN